MSFQSHGPISVHPEVCCPIALKFHFEKVRGDGRVREEGRKGGEEGWEGRERRGFWGRGGMEGRERVKDSSTR